MFLPPKQLHGFSIGDSVEFTTDDPWFKETSRINAMWSSDKRISGIVVDLRDMGSYGSAADIRISAVADWGYRNIWVHHSRVRHDPNFREVQERRYKEGVPAAEERAEKNECIWVWILLIGFFLFFLSKT